MLSNFNIITVCKFKIWFFVNFGIQLIIILEYKSKLILVSINLDF
jgi:hypothetical protein